jgi:hypothetical protein
VGFAGCSSSDDSNTAVSGEGFGTWCESFLEIQQEAAELGPLEPDQLAPAGQRLLDVSEQVPESIRADWVAAAESLAGMAPAAEDLAAGRISESQFYEQLESVTESPEILAANQALTEAIARECGDDLPPTTSPASPPFETAMFCDRFVAAKFGEDHAEVAGPTSTVISRTPEEAVEYYQSIEALVPAELQEQMAAIVGLHESAASGAAVSEADVAAADRAKEELADWLRENCDLDYGLDEL